MNQKEMQTRKKAVERDKIQYRKNADAKLEWKIGMPRHKKQQGLVKYYTKEDDIRSWLRNMETISKNEEIPAGDCAFVLTKTRSSEPLKIDESVLDYQLNNYDYLKQIFEQHFT